MYDPIPGTIRCTCKKVLEREVLSSAAGYYVGRFCDCCGPYSRESMYFPTRETADEELARIEEWCSSKE
jgi:hypothetical protein